MVNAVNNNVSYRGAFSAARRHFGARYPSARRILKGSLIVGVSSALFMSYFPGVIPVLGICLALDLIAVGWVRLRGGSNQLLRNLVEASQRQDVDPHPLAENLSSYTRWGHKQMAFEFLTELRELDGTKFNEVLSVMQETRRGKSLALAYTRKYCVNLSTEPVCRQAGSR